jgi:hypothetical protein
MKRNTGIMLWFISVTFLATFLNSWYFFFGIGITGLYFCIKYELDRSFG